MKDFPVFTTENGVASLILKEIPYRKESYIRIHSSLSPDEFLEECISFCRICGAERIYAAGAFHTDQFPLHTTILEMRGTIAPDSYETVSICPVTKDTAFEWRQIYNQKMLHIDNASTLESRDEEKLYLKPGAYFIRKEDTLLGIGWIDGTNLSAIASLQPGAGAEICQAMQSLIPSGELMLEVASTNLKAIRLYKSLGLKIIKEKSRWYQVFDGLSSKNT